ncbi:ABC transporter ATP-binding protein [Pyxidicoccus sp. MSG2]|uniref:ABC transporter ATP-binding protein n=1 Tax=Pyxidicoccus sp. MSG2 TaxID=2996790 RepID=UPI0022718BD2|nr:ABC transporter ATP-binding protein [Pyxidicoccus sp. MSG2]MCY1021113.1 ABC transporter ATP-binding protein [Pyxidicoccus sp. MSG2]
MKIRLKQALKQFGAGAKALTVLDHVDLEVREHEFVVLVGPSGCGKTTLLGAIAGFVALDAGTLEIDGQRVRGPSRRRIYVSQEPSVFPWLTVEENVAFPLADLPAEAREAEVARQLSRVGLADFRNHYPVQLSGGMKQRLEFARALAAEPEMLLLDEPFGALDPFTRHEHCRELARLWLETRKTCVMVTHDIEEACALATRIVVMSTRPARIIDILDNPLPRPRDLTGDGFHALKTRIHRLLQLVPSI